MLCPNSTCCKCTSFVIDAGYSVCVSCGQAAARALDSNITCFAQQVALLRVSYTRRSRFEKKILAALLGRQHHTIDVDLLRHIESSGASTPEAFLAAMGTYESKLRRPYIFVTKYWQATNRAIPVLGLDEEKFIVSMFDDIFFSWERLNLENPQFPYCTLLRLIINHYNCSSEARKLLRFARVLRCEKRRARYAMCFEKCLRYIQEKDERSEAE